MMSLHLQDKANGGRFAVILCLFDALMVVSFSTALTLGVLTYTSIRDARTISVRYRALQLKLLIAVTAQVGRHLQEMNLGPFFQNYFNLGATSTGFTNIGHLVFSLGPSLGIREGRGVGMKLHPTHLPPSRV